ncbi:SIR2 family protein [Rhodococcus qingshengii]|uniref:SIR2 family protein n=1 Tax=Rhodococcus qingshengii TaxID=334542 RepID=UPI001C5F2FC5|nr:SIR2 family protein [Rhodococcus qingshengii]MBW4818433.1 SIR2 family protein [Rhodococcus qingshengii]
MSAPDLTRETMDQFRESGAEAHTTILLGAGASVTSGLPDWDTFATRLLTQSGSVSNTDLARLLVQRQDPLLVVEAARMAFGDRWAQKLRATLFEGVASIEPSPLHLAAVGHLLSGDRTDTSLVTLNFDTLLEQSITDETGIPALPAVDGSEADDGYTVHHLHGIITPKEAREVILTLTDFTDLIANGSSWQLEYLRAAVQRGALVIAGTSYRDPDVRQWLRTALQAGSTHAALVLLARQGFRLSKEEFSQVERAFSDQWRAIGIQPVLLQDHSDAAQIIRELRHVHSSSYLAPQERSRAVWDAHYRSFTHLQQEYVNVLSLNAEVMKDALDVEHLNLTLWLADGNGKLARWAAQDRIYRDFFALRTVETGHDSPWIAGQALGADTLLHQDLDERDTRRWRSVLALPVPVPHPHLPTLSTAVLTIGLPDPAIQYDSSRILWGEPLAEIADDWGTRLSDVAFGS